MRRVIDLKDRTWISVVRPGELVRRGFLRDGTVETYGQRVFPEMKSIRDTMQEAKAWKAEIEAQS